MRGWNPLVPLVLVSVVAVTACEKPPTEPTGQTDTFLAKPSCPGHPSCKPDDPPPDPGTAPDPVIAFSEAGGRGLWLMDDDGSNQVEVYSDGDWAVHAPSWAPFGDGTVADPWRLVFWRESTQSLATISIDTVGGAVNARELQAVNVPSPARDPDWGPTGEILYKTKVLVPETGLLHDAIYVISDVDLPNPTPVYVAINGDMPEFVHGLFGAVWSPWGDAIVFVEEDETSPYYYEKTLKIVDRWTGALTTVSDYGQFPGSGFGMDWSKTPSNPSFLAFVVESEDPKNGKPVRELRKLQLTDPEGHYVIGGQSTLLATGAIFPTWSPDDTRLLVGDFRRMKTVDASSGNVVATLARRDGRSSDWRR